jgi:hypothetical protein
MTKALSRGILRCFCLVSGLVSCARTQPGHVSTLESASKTPVTVSAEERVVQAQLEAYNRHDIDAFVATYAADVRGYRYPDQQTFAGLDSLRTGYAQFFAGAPNVRATVLARIVQGRFVIDHEELTGLPNGRTQRAVAIYEVRDGRIATVRFLR